MPTVLLIRHGRTTANTAQILAGRTPGVHLDDTGRDQVARCGTRIADLSLAHIVTSPLDRCRETTEAIAAAQPSDVPVATEDGLLECDYGRWQGRPLGELAREPLWAVVQRHPAAAVFPGGESLAGMQARAVEAIRRWDARIAAEHGPSAVWAAVSHGDLIKAILSDALGMHLDLFQRLHIDPASVSIVSYGEHRPDVIAMNTTAGDYSWLQAHPIAADAAVGGGAGA